MLSPGKVLEIDLTTRQCTQQPYPEGWAVTYLAGRGFNAAWLYAHLAADTDALGPENPLMFSCGLLTGKTAPSASRVHINALSPLTGLLGSSNVGGNFGVRLRGCGIQSIIVRGRADAPVYLFIDSDGPQIRPADHLWGLDTWRTQQQLRSELADDRLQVLTIGPAGENGVRFACIITDVDHAAGRTGMGTVMGSKNLKAIVVQEARHDPNETTSRGRAAVRNYVRKIRKSAEYATFSRFGGAGYVKWAGELGILAARNFRSNKIDAIDRIDGRRLDKHKVRSRGCYRCPIKCKAQLDFKMEGPLSGLHCSRPEFESLANLGAKCDIGDMQALVRIDNLCSLLGMDIISTANAVAFAMDLFARGILTAADFEGIELTWGDAAAAQVLVHQIAEVRGLGSILSLGVRRAAEIIGNGANRYAPHIKGLELPAYHPAHLSGTCLGYAVSSRGGDFSNIYASMEYTWSGKRAAAAFGTKEAVRLDGTYGKAGLIRRAMLVNATIDSLGICKVQALSLIGDFDMLNEAQLCSALTAFEFQALDLMRIGERIINLERLLNQRFGSGAQDDRLPRMFSEPGYSGPDSQPPAAKLEKMLRMFYAQMGWDAQGQPTVRKLRRLGITAAVPDADAA
jgi:aldehyde:ferredoxin oxidoreductase